MKSSYSNALRRYCQNSFDSSSRFDCMMGWGFESTLLHSRVPSEGVFQGPMKVSAKALRPYNSKTPIFGSKSARSAGKTMVYITRRTGADEWYPPLQVRSLSFVVPTGAYT